MQIGTETPMWSPPNLSTVFTEGEKDENGIVCGCFRIPAIVKAAGTYNPFLMSLLVACVALCCVVTTL